MHLGIPEMGGKVVGTMTELERQNLVHLLRGIGLGYRITHGTGKVEVGGTRLPRVG